MLRAFLRTARAEARSDWLPPAVVFVILVLAAATTVQAVAIRSGAAGLWDGMVEETNAHDIYLASDRSDADFSPIDTIAGVDETAGPFSFSERLKVIDAETRAQPVTLFAADQPPSIDTPRFVAGRWPQDRGEIALDFEVARELGREPGDAVTFADSSGVETSYTIVGTAVNAVSCFPADCEPRLGYVTDAGLERAAPTERTGTVYLVRLDDAGLATQVVTIAERALRPGTINTIGRGDVSRDTVLDEPAITGLGYAAFAGVTILVGGVAIANLIGLGTLYRRRELALMKAIGTTPRQIGAYLMLQALALGATAFAVGAVIGLGLTAYALRDLITSLDAGPIPPIDLPGMVIAFLIVEGAVAIATAIPAWRAGRTPAVSTVGRSAGPSRTVMRRGADRLPLTVAVGIRQSFARTRRTMLTIATLVLALAAVVVALGSYRTIQEHTDRPELLGDPFDLFVNDSSFTLADAEDLLGADSRIDTIFTRRSFLVRVNSDPEFVNARVVGGDYAQAGYHIPEGRMVAGPGEAVAAYGFLERFGLDVGDDVTVLFAGERIDLRLVGRHGESDDNGVIIMFDEADLPFPVPTSVTVKLHERDDVDGVLATILGAYPGLETEAEHPGPGATIDSLRTTLLALSLVLALVALVNAVGTAVLTVGEQQRDIGVLKTLGFTPRQIMTTVTAGNAAVGVIAAVAGLGVGLVGLQLVLRLVGIEIGTGPDFGSLPSWWESALLAVLAVVVTTGATWIAGRRAATISPADALRYE